MVPTDNQLICVELRTTLFPYVFCCDSQPWLHNRITWGALKKKMSGSHSRPIKSVCCGETQVELPFLLKFAKWSYMQQV